MKVGSVEIELFADITQYLKSMDESQRVAAAAAKSIQKAFDNVINFNLLERGFGALQQGLKEVVAQTTEAEVNMAKVNQALVSTSGAAGMTAKSVTDLSSSLARLSTVDDDAINGASALMLTFTRVGKDVFPSAMKAVNDMSVALGTDLHAATIQVGKALNNPIQGVTALQKVGVSFTESQKALIKTLEETGHHAEAQAIVMRELQTEFGGAAAAARDTLDGALKDLQKNIGEVAQAIGLPGGLRDLVELTDEAMVELSQTITELKDPTTALGKQFLSFSQGTQANFGNLLESAKAWADITIEGFIRVGKAAGEIWKVFDGVMRFINPIYKAIEDFGAKAVEAMGKYLKESNEQAKQLVKDQAIPDYIKSWYDPVVKTLDGIQKRSKEKLAQIKADAASFKGVGNHDDGEGIDAKAAKAAAKELAKEEKAIQGVLDAFAQKNQALELQAKGEQKYVDLMQAEKKIMDQQNVSGKDKIAAMNKLMDMEARRVELEKQIKENDEKKKLDEVVASMTEANQKAMMRLNSSKELNHVLDAEDAIRKILGKDTQVGVEQQQKILDLARQAAEIEKEQDHKAALKSMQDMLDAQKESIRDDQLKLQGLEDMIPLYKQIDEIQKNKDLTDADKNSQIQQMKDLYNQHLLLNDQLADQDEKLKNIVKSAKSVEDGQEKLKYAWDRAMISGKQYKDGLAEINAKFADQKNKGSEVAKIIGDGLEKMISGTVKVSEGFKEMGKQLALFAAKELLLKPIENLITNMGNALTGNGGPSGGWLNTPGATGTGGGVGGALGRLASGIGGALGLPKFASGGMARGGQMALFGENGPELGVPRQDMHIFTAPQTQQIFSQYGQNGFGQYAANLDPYQAMPPDLAAEAVQFHQAMFRQQTQATLDHLPPDSPYRAELQQELAWGGNPMKEVIGATTNAAGQTVDPGNFGHSYEAFAATGLPMSERMAAFLRRRDQYQQGIQATGINYGASAGNGATSFGGGDGGAGEFAGYAVGGQGGNMPIDPYSKWGIFGEGSSGSAFGGYKGASNEYLDNIKGWNKPSGVGPGAWSQGAGGPGVDYAAGGGTGGWVDEAKQAWLDARDAAANKALQGMSGTQATLNGMGGYLPETSGAGMINKDPYSSIFGGYGMGESPWKTYPGRFQKASVNDLVSAGVYKPATLQDLGMSWLGALPIWASAAGSGITAQKNVSLDTDIFEQSNNSWGGKSQDPRFARYVQASNIDNSGLTEGLINGALGYNKLPGRADGGPVNAGKSYKVGERGHKEVFIPNTDGAIFPLDKGSIAPKITINNNHANVHPQDISVKQQGSNIIVDLVQTINSKLANNGSTANVMLGRYAMLPATPRRS